MPNIIKPKIIIPSFPIYVTCLNNSKQVVLSRVSWLSAGAEVSCSWSSCPIPIKILHCDTRTRTRYDIALNPSWQIIGHERSYKENIVSILSQIIFKQINHYDD